MGCGIGDSAKKIADSFEDLSEKAGDLITDINALTLLVDSKIESGELTAELGDLMDNQLSQAIESIESAMQNTGGYLFGELNGTINNAFVNISILLEQLNQGILGETLPTIIDQVSSQLQMQVNSITMAVEDMLVYTMGSTMVIVDKTANSLVVLIAAVLLAIGLLIFIILLIKRKIKLKGAKLIAFIFMMVYIVFFLCVLVIPKFRAHMIVGFDYGKKLDVKAFEPKFTSVIPETLVLGNNNRLYIYGRHLDKIDQLGITLNQGMEEKFKFPNECIIVATGNRIVLGNFESGANWSSQRFDSYNREVLQSSELQFLSLQNFKEYSYSINQSIYPGIIRNLIPARHITPIIQPLPVVIPHFVDMSLPTLGHVAMAPETITSDPAEGIESAIVETESVTTPILNLALASAKSLKRVDNAGIYQNMKREKAQERFGTNIGQELIRITDEYYNNHYRLPEGDYGIFVFADKDTIDSPLFLNIVYPPPPVPDPDISPVRLRWAGGITPVTNENTTLELSVGFAYPQEIDYPFEAKIISVPPITPVTVTVPMGKIAAATGSNLTTVMTRSFSINESGNYRFTVSIDEENRINESNERNNTYSTNLQVNEETYEVRLTEFRLRIKDDAKNIPKLKLKLSSDVTGYSTWRCNKNFNKSGSNEYNINCNKNYSSVKPGQAVSVSCGVIGEINFFFLKLEINLGTVIFNKKLSANPTGTASTSEQAIKRETKYFELTGKMIINER